VLVAALALLLGQGSEGLSEQSRRAHEAWALCTGLSAYSQVSNPDPPAEVAEIALRQCERQEAALRKALRRQFNGASVDRTIETLRGVARDELPRRVTEARRGASPRK
jgi:hypothetical protein